MKTLVVKLSSLAVTTEDGKIHKKQMKAILSDLAQLSQKHKYKIVLVSSGAINAGKNSLKAKDYNSISTLQACASIGQPILMHEFQKVLKTHELQCAQVLVTHEDLKNKKRAHNIRGTLLKLLDEGIIPIINENDTVSFDEITVGDNDQLSAMISNLLGIKTLIMLSTPNGLYDKDPKDPTAKHYPLIKYDESFNSLNLSNKSSAGRGGMKTKLQAIRKLTPLGHNIIISSFKNDSPLIAPLTGECGSLFLGAPTEKENNKRSWMLAHAKNDCGLIIDEGAFKALSKNSSLLPVGVKKVKGSFKRGDCIEVIYQGQIVAVGLSEYDHNQVEKIKGVKSQNLSEVLSTIAAKVVIHKNNLLIKEKHK
jgi:glutamate 5-kinase